MTPRDRIDDYLGAEADPDVVARYLEHLASCAARDQTGAMARECDAIRAERDALLQQQAALQAELDELGLVRIEMLVVFLPVIFRDFWTVVRPDELAMMCGRIAPPQIASPYLEPSPETVGFMKARLEALPAADRARIRRFGLGLSHHLQVRAEMRAFMRASATD